MANPQTVNVGIIVPLTGVDVDLWGANDVNPNMVALDGMLAGVQTIGASSVPITLTAPAGFVPTPGGGPTQAQNRVLRFTGALTANVTVTLPLPGAYVIENLTTGNFALILRGATPVEMIGIPPGEIIEVYNDGANVRFVGLGRPGSMELWAGLASIPLWVGVCTVKPYLLCDGTNYNFGSYPALANRLLGAFGGNGITTFGTPDLRGRVPLAYDGTGGRITVAGCGLNGQVLGAALDAQTVQLTLAQIPQGITSSNAANAISVLTTLFVLGNTVGNSGSASGGGTQMTASDPGSGAVLRRDTSSGNNAIAVTSDNTGGAAHNNVQPSQVVGIWVIKT